MPEVKRVLVFATAYYPHASGAEIAVHEIAERLAPIEFDLVCARLERGLSRDGQHGRVRIHRVGFGTKFDKYLLPFFGPLRALRLQKPDVVWSLMASYGGFTALFYCWLRPRSRLLLTLQEGDPLEHYEQRLGPFAFLQKRIFMRANAVQAISRFLADWAARMGFRGTPHVIPNGVQSEFFTYKIDPDERRRVRASVGFSETDIVLIHTGRYSKKNALDDLIKAIALLPASFKALLIGGGEDEQMLKDLVKQLGVSDRVVFMPSKPNAELPAYLQASDVFVRASLSEGLGISFLEAMAAGIPIIATPVGGIPDFLLDGETGVACRPRDPGSIAEAALKLARDASLKSRIIHQARAIASSRYDWDKIAARMRAILEAL